jgi:hypothetical protein
MNPGNGDASIFRSRANIPRCSCVISVTYFAIVNGAISIASYPALAANAIASSSFQPLKISLQMAKFTALF